MLLVGAGTVLIAVAAMVAALYLATSVGGAGVGSTWVYAVRLPSGVVFEEAEVIDGAHLCGLQICLEYLLGSAHARTSLSITRDWVLLRSETSDGTGNSRSVTYDTGLPLYKRPLQPGMRWTWQSTGERTDRIHVPNRGTVTRAEPISVQGDERRVQGLDTVSVPAGVFRTALVEHRDQNGVLLQQIWFSDEAREGVRFLGGLGSVFYTDRELSAYILQPAGSDVLQVRIAVLPLWMFFAAGVGLIAAARWLGRSGLTVTSPRPDRRVDLDELAHEEEGDAEGERA